jgi:DNA-directed RNA polymerase specialized sigma24 family protein
VYGIVPRDLAAKLYGTLSRFYENDAGIEVVIDERTRDRRARAGRRTRPPHRARMVERRQVRGPEGRRVAERRAAVPVLADPSLPRSARRYTSRIRFVVTLGEGGRHEADLDDARLVLRIQAGEREAFEHLYKTWFDAAYAYLQMVFPRPAETEERVQRVFRTVLDTIRDLDVRQTPFRVRMARALHEQWWREADNRDATGATESATPERWGPGQDLAVLEGLNDRDLLALIARLPGLQRDTIAFRYLMNLTASEIGEVIGRLEDQVEALDAGALSFMAGCVTALSRRPGYSGRHPMRARVEAGRVLRGRQLALTR